MRENGKVWRRVREKAKLITKELIRPAPFTVFDAFTGIAIMLLLAAVHLPCNVSEGLFETLQPIHVLLSSNTPLRIDVVTLGLIIASTTLVSLISLIGVIFLLLKTEILDKILLVLVSFAAGTLLGGAMLHLIPRSLELAEAQNIRITTLMSTFLLGIVMFFVLETLLHWHHCHKPGHHLRPFVYFNLIGDGLHNFIDGMIIAVSFLSGISLGVVVTIAIAFHEIPQEVGDFSLLVYGGLSKKRALGLNLVSAIAALLGGVTTYFIATHMEYIEGILLMISGASFMYIGMADLIPELREKSCETDATIRKPVIQILVVTVGIILMLALALLEVH